MTYYEKIEKYLEVLNAKQDIQITIDYIDAKEIIFCVYDCEIANESLQTIYEVLHFINSGSSLNNITNISYNSGRNCSVESFNLRFELDIGEDTESEEELRQKAEDYAEELAFERYKEEKRGIY